MKNELDAVAISGDDKRRADELDRTIQDFANHDAHMLPGAPQSRPHDMNGTCDMPTLTEGQTLFVIDLDYLVPIEQVEPHIDAHMAFIDAGYAAGHFLASGPKIPRKGGIVLARGTDVAEVEALMATDPFTVAGVTRVTVTPFVARRLDPALTGAAPT